MSTYQTVWDMDAWVEACGRWSDARFKGLDFETAPDPRNIAKANPIRCEDGARVAGTALSWVDRGDDVIRSAYGPSRHWRVSAGGTQLPARHAFKCLSDAIVRQPEDSQVVVHNIQMEASFMLAEGICWPEEGQFHDLMIATRVLNMGVGWKELIGLKSLQGEYLGRDLTSKNDVDTWLLKNRFKKGRDIWRAPVAIASVYAQDDARDCLELWLRWWEAVYQPPTRWWWYRKPDRRQRHDLYELEVETAIQACLGALRGNRVDHKLCRRRSSAAETLQSVCRRWVRSYLEMPTINPGSATQMRGILFSDAFGKLRGGDNPKLEVSLSHLTQSFHKLKEREQAAVLAGRSKKSVVDYASLDAEAMQHYAESLPEHSDLFFILAVYRKCQTAEMWFTKNFGEYTSFQPDPWWERTAQQAWLYMIYHRLRTVGTIPGRMSSADFNAQQVPKRFKLLFDAIRLADLLQAFLPPDQFAELIAMMDTAEVSEGDESKVLGLEPGSPVFDFSARAMFIPRPGNNQKAHDLSQVEMRLFAHYSGNKLLCEGYGVPDSDELMNVELEAIRRVAFDDVSMREAFQGIDVSKFARADRKKSFDIHAFVAQELDIARKPAKGINFGIVYGMGKKKLSRSLGFSLREGQAYLARYHARFPEIQIVQARIKVALRDRGYVFDAAGRRYYLEISRAYVGLNRLIQGYAATVFKIGFVRNCHLFTGAAMGGGGVHPVTRRRHMGRSIVNTCIHDEILSEIPYELDHGLADYAIRANMVLIHGLKVPLGTSSETSPKSWDDCSETGEQDFLGLVKRNNEFLRNQYAKMANNPGNDK